MKSVFIVNRDPDFVFDFQSLIDWSGFNCKIVGCSNSGIKALGEILRKKPDLVFISNSLPGLSGINVIDKIHSHGLLAEFVLIEDKGDFRLAQKAMKLGVREYLVKPVTASDLMYTLSDFIDRYQAHHSKDMESYLVTTRRLLRNSFMRNFVSAEEPHHFSIIDLNSQYHFSFQEGIFQGVLIQVRNLPRDKEESFLPVVTEELRFRFDPVCYEMIPFVQGANRLTLLFNYSPESGVSDRLSEIHDIVRESLAEFDCADVSYSIGIGSPNEDVNSLLETLHSAERAAYCSILRGSDGIFFMERQRFDGLQKGDVITQDFMSDLGIAVEMMDIVKYENVLRRAFDKLGKYSDPELLVEICCAGIAEVLKACNDSQTVSRDEIRTILYEVVNYPTIPGIVRALTENAAISLEAVKKEREFSRPLREATKFIKENFMNDLTLANVADHVHLNASYLSMLFKKETGRNYMTFLTDCRIEEAKHLLKESGLSVAEICYAVGYTDKKHFSRLFIKHVGIRPTAYRSLH